MTKAPDCTVCDYLHMLIEKKKDSVGAHLALQAHEQALHPEKKRGGPAPWLKDQLKRAASTKPPDTE